MQTPGSHPDLETFIRRVLASPQVSVVCIHKVSDALRASVIAQNPRARQNPRSVSRTGMSGLHRGLYLKGGPSR